MNLPVDSTRLWSAALVLAVYAALCSLVAYRVWRKREAVKRSAAGLTPSAGDAPRWLVAYASQTGFGEQLAWQTARLLHTAGASARIAALGTLDARELQSVEHALFVVSTYGEGDQPDSAAPFVRRLMAAPLRLDHLQYGVLALGDRAYRHFCGFGRRLDEWLRSGGAQPLLSRIEVNNGEPAAVTRWQHEIAHLVGAGDLPEWQAPPFEPWRISARHHLNPGSAGEPCFHIELEPCERALPDWQSGDLVQMRVADDPRPREYSIASLPDDGRVHLLVRQERHEDGSLGAASGLLTAGAPLGATIELRLRRHAGFHLGANAARPLILIGNGTGLAGLRSHLKARAATGQRQNWLIFGERNARYDDYYRDELETWRQQGVLTHVDLVFSRDQSEKRYVQDRLCEAANSVREWVDNDAAVYVCGSLQGMAGDVEAALSEILGAARLRQLTEEGRYRRDVY